MAISLYDRGEAGDSILSSKGACIRRSATSVIRDFLEAVAEADGAVDLRDLSTVIKDSVDDVILNEIIRRRLSTPAAPEQKTIPATLDEDWNIKWLCGSSATSQCVYDNETDPAHDECVYCGQPQERK
jgi:hypothetical protein